MNFSQWLPLAAVCLLGAMSPGPSLAMIVRHTLGGGRRNGFVAAWCHSSGIAIYAVLSVLGLAVLLLKAQSLFHVIALIGGGYLLWMGWGAFHQSAGTLEFVDSQSRLSLQRAARDAFAISLLNPKILLFFIALFSSFVEQAQGVHGILIATPWLIDGLWYSLIVLLLTQSHVLNWLRHHRLWFDRLTGIILLGLGADVVLGSASILWTHLS